MELRDLIVTPVVLFIVYGLAYWIRPKVTDVNTRRYFIPGLTVKIFGALALGFIYQFYYSGGDTFGYHFHGSRIMWEAFIENPDQGIKLFLSNGEHIGETYKYSSRIWYFRDSKAFQVIRIAFVFDLITFSSYAATAVLFAVLSFSGAWALYRAFYDDFKELHFYLALTALFIPSVFFWGSGILKDSLTLASLGWLTYSFRRIFIQGKAKHETVFILLVSAVLIYSIKKYILLSFLPALILWAVTKHFYRLRSTVLKILLAPSTLGLCFILGYWAIVAVAQEDSRYALGNIARTAQITAYDIRYGWGARFGEGSGYSLGELDGTLRGMLELAPYAVNVSLFRPYLWEVKNPLMLLSAIEALICLCFTIWVFYKAWFSILMKSLLKPEIMFCMVFSVVFAVAVGISTYNFGTLARYKIPLMPFYFTGLILIYNNLKSNKDRKLSLLDANE